MPGWGAQASHGDSNLSSASCKSILHMKRDLIRERPRHRTSGERALDRRTQTIEKQQWLAPDGERLAIIPEPPIEKRRDERGLVITVAAFDWNCSQHVTPRFTAEVARAILPLK